MQPDLFQRKPAFDGPDFTPALDADRLTRQMDRIRDYMLSVEWVTLAEIHAALGYPEASISAQLRHLRKPRFGGYQVDRRRRTQGSWEYRIALEAA